MATRILLAALCALLPMAMSATRAGGDDLPGAAGLRALLEPGSWGRAESLAVAARDSVLAGSPVDSLALAEAGEIIVTARLGGGRMRTEGTRELADESLAARERLLDPRDPRIAASLSALGRVLSALGDLEAARPLQERALAIREAALGPDHPEVALSLNYLGVLHGQSGDFPGAKVLFERAVAVRERALGPEHPDVAMSLNNLALVLSKLGDYAGALRCHQRTVAIFEKAYGPEHLKLAAALGNLADVYRIMGDYEEAAKLQARALRIAEQSEGPDHLIVGQHLSIYGVTLSLLGENEAARRLFERALVIRERALGPEHPDVGATLFNLAEECRRSGDPAGAVKRYTRVLAIFEKSLGPDHPSVGECCNNLGVLKRDMGDSTASRHLLERALAIRSAAFGPDNPLVGETLAELATTAARVAPTAEALDQAIRGERITRDQLRLTARVLPERQALRYAAVRVAGLNPALALAASGRVPESADAAWNELVSARAMVLDEMAERRHTVNHREEEDVRALRASFDAASERLARVLVEGAGIGDPAAARRRIDDARATREAAESALAERSAPFRDERARQRISLADVRAALPEGSALVAYARYESAGEPGVEAGRSAIVALVLADREARAVAVRLGSESSITLLASRWHDEASFGTPGPRGSSAERDERCRQAGDSLRMAVWDPIEPLLPRVDRVFVVPEGPLHLVNFAALPAANSPAAEFLVDRDPVINLLACERDLVTTSRMPGGVRGENAGLLALGGPAFDADPASAPAAQVAAAPPPFRGPLSDCADFAALRLAPLPGSLREAESIAAIWKRAARTIPSPAIVLTGESAREAAVKELAPGKRILHFATHGFFISANCDGASKIGPDASTHSGEHRGIGSLRPSSRARESAGQPFGEARRRERNPLQLSGLVLAGANRRANPGRTGDDGILTAEEIASLDLEGVEWAVLSACDTGIGDIGDGEGVFGLRRSFLVAGARTVIMSLWAVRDDDARRWMETLYEQHLLEGLDTAASARAATRSLLAERRARGQSTHPFFWAAFVTAGDWR